MYSDFYPLAILFANFFQLYVFNIGNAFWFNVHAAIFFAMIIYRNWNSGRNQTFLLHAAGSTAASDSNHFFQH
jgi:hypothetical protein